jgi:hypothetical protein
MWNRYFNEIQIEFDFEFEFEFVLFLVRVDSGQIKVGNREASIKTEVNSITIKIALNCNQEFRY